MSEKKTTLEMRIELVAKEALESVHALKSETVDLAKALKEMNLGTEKTQKSLSSLEGFTTKAAGQMKLFGTNAADVKKQQDALKNTISKLVDDGLDPESKAVKTLVDRYKDLGEQSGKIEKLNSENVDSFDKLKKAITDSAAAVALLKIADKGREFGAFALGAADTFQKARNEFGTMLQDMEAGAALFDSVKLFADKTPFALDELKQATSLLLTADTPLSDINNKLAMFGDIAQGNSQKFISFIDAFSKGAARGTVDMRVLNVYLSQGVPILAELAKTFETTKEGVLDMVSQGKLSIEDFTQALENLASEGGIYFGGMELASRDLSAMQEGLDEAVTTLAASFGDMLLPAMKGVLQMFTDVVNAVNESPLLKGILAGALVAVTSYLTAMAVKQALVAVKTWVAYAAQMGFNSALAVTNPLLLAGIAAATAATVAIVAYASNQQNAAKSVNEHALALKSADQAAQSFNDTLSKMSNTDLSTKIQSSAIELVALQRQLSNAQREFAKTPARIVETFELGGGDAMTYDYGENERYAELVTIISNLNEQIDSTKKRLSQMGGQIDLNKINAELAYGNEILAARDGLYQSTTEYQKGQLEKQIAFTKSLYDMQTRNEDGSYSGFDVSKTDAILKKLQKDLDSLTKTSVKIFGTEWQDKSLTGLEAINREQEKAIEALKAHALDALGSQYEQKKEYEDELFALGLFYDQKRAELNKQLYEKIGTTWQDSLLSGTEVLTKQLSEELQKLASSYNASEQTDSDYADYMAEKQALLKWEYQERRKLERELVLHEHQLRLDAIKEEWEYQKELAREAGDYGEYAKNASLSQIADTDVGQLIAGVDPMTMFIDAVIGAITELENVNKLLNFMGTFVDAMFEVIGPIIDGAAKDFVDQIVEMGRSLGQVIAPVLGILAVNFKVFAGILQITSEPLKALGRAFEWLYNHVIVPFGNKFIDIINGVIGALNKIPFVDIKKIEKLQVIGDLAVELAQEMEKQVELIKKKFDRQRAAVEDLLRVQINSIQNQYELGLISRQDYEKKAEAYKNAADLKIIDINQEQLEALAQIEKNTYNALPDVKKDYDPSNYTVAFHPTAGTPGVISPAENTVAAEVALSQIKDTSLGSFIRNIAASFDIGSTFVPRDMLAMVHKREIIVPESFAEGIRSNKLALTGPDWKDERRELLPSAKTSASSNVIYVQVNVEGSVIKKDDLVSEVYDGLAYLIESKRKAPLPA